MSIAVQTVGWQAGFLAVLPAIQTHARIQFRKLPPERREDAIQEAISSACYSYHRLAVRGRLHVVRPSMLATYAVNYVRNFRHLGGRQDSARDVMSPLCQRRHGVRVHEFQAAQSGDIVDGWRYLTLPNRKAKIPDLAAFRVDFAAWLRSLSHRDRRIVDRLACGDRTMEVADKFRLTWGRVSQLRRRFERDWCVFQGEKQPA